MLLPASVEERVQACMSLPSDLEQKSPLCSMPVRGRVGQRAVPCRVQSDSDIPLLFFLQAWCSREPCITSPRTTRVKSSFQKQSKWFEAANLVLVLVHLVSRCMGEQYIVGRSVGLCGRVPTGAPRVENRSAPSWRHDAVVVPVGHENVRLIEGDPVLHSVTKQLVARFCVRSEVVSATAATGIPLNDSQRSKVTAGF